MGADAFLPALTEELIWSPDIGETQLDVEFLMELLDPEELLGEGEPPSPGRQNPTLGRPKQQADKRPGPSVELRLPVLLVPSRVLPDHMVWGAAPHCPLPAGGGTRAPGAQL